MDFPRIRWWRTDFEENDLARLHDALRNRTINQGPLCGELEARLADELGVPYVVLTTSGSAALFLALRACGVEPGDEVLIPALTFVATAHASFLAGARVRLVDVRADKPVIDVDRIEAAITDRTRAIVPVHLNGASCDIKALGALARRHSLSVVEDAAQAFTSASVLGRLGTLSDAGAFSMGVTKLITCGEGGFVAVRDESTYRRLIRLRNHGVANLRDGAFDEPGFNFKFNDLLAGFALAQIEKLDRKREGVRRVHEFYRTRLADLDDLRVLDADTRQGELPLWTEIVTSQRDRVITRLAEQGIEARPFEPCLADSRHIGNAGGTDDVSRARTWAARGLILPSGPDRTADELDAVVRVLRAIGKRTSVESGVREAERAIFNTEDVLEVDSSMLERLKERARSSRQGCFRLCLHHSPEDAVQEMLIACTPRYYCRPHCHPDAPTTIHLVEGRLTLLLFHDDGRPGRRIELGTPTGDRAHSARLAPGAWHAVFCEADAVFLEVSRGPYVKSAANAYAEWSPVEGSPEVERYVEGWRKPSFDRARLRLRPLAERRHKLDVSIVQELELVETDVPALIETAGAMRSARGRGSAVMFMIGGHVLRAGVQRHLIDLMEHGLVSCIAMNGSGVIHDFELALVGATTEDVESYLADGQFGLWKETGEINGIVSRAARENLGLGEAVGRAIATGDFPHREISVLAAGYRLGVPVTVHVGIGYDIVFEHPDCDGAAWGATSYRDFLRYAHVIEGLDGGVVATFGSAVMAPEVFLKALAMARNVAHAEGRRIVDFTSLVCDLVPLPGDYREEPGPGDPAYYFRPRKTLLIRAVAGGGRSLYVQGHHGETIPRLWSAVRAGEHAR